MLKKDQISQPHNNVDEKEIAKFTALAHDWRDPNGRFASVLAFNEIRLSYITSQLNRYFGGRKLSILDVGCGAGLLTQPLAELGHYVVGIDANATNIEVAKFHSRHLHNLSYRHELSHTLLQESQRFDLVLNTEVIEHVPNPAQLLEECGELVSAEGMMIVATLNRTLLSYLVGIVGAEYILKALPKGTHSWTSFVTPYEVQKALRSKGFTIGNAQGMTYNPLTKKWRLTHSDKVNYILPAFKNELS
jgi:2-polyprenyl-6-hydroxyphenyl methylase/3-demethylubiquinone-9 3-methyltransferase